METAVDQSREEAKDKVGKPHADQSILLSMQKC